MWNFKFERMSEKRNQFPIRKGKQGKEEEMQRAFVNVQEKRFMASERVHATWHFLNKTQ